MTCFQDPGNFKENSHKRYNLIANINTDQQSSKQKSF